MKKWILLLLSALLFGFACGGQQPDEVEDGNGDLTDETVSGDEEYVLPEADVYLVLSDSIGIELGDSNYVFGQIAGADITPEGDIVVLDMQKMCISLFSPRGEFIMRVGRQGSGPGEFQLPAGISSFPGGGAVVSDAMGGKLIIFDSNLEYVSDVAGFFPAPPAVISGIEGGALVGMKPDFEQNEEGMFMGFTIARWEPEQTEPSVTYFQSMSPFDPSDLSSIQDDIVSFGTAPDGRVFTASLSTEEYSFISWSPEGEELFTVTDEDFLPVPKTQEEIELETELINNRMIQQGMPPAMANWEPDPFRTAIGGLWVDGYDRLWITKGTTVTPSFNVYDLQGNFLFSAALDVGIRARTWQVLVQEDRFLAFDADPEFYPLVYIGELPGAIQIDKSDPDSPI